MLVAFFPGNKVEAVGLKGANSHPTPTPSLMNLEFLERQNKILN